MDVAKRNELIDAYYDAVDEETYEEFDRAFAEDARHVRPGQGALEGRRAIREFFSEERRSSNTVHSVSRRLHDEDATYCKVRVSGELDSERFEGDIVAEFEFTPDDERIAGYRVFRGYQR